MTRAGLLRALAAAACAAVVAGPALAGQLVVGAAPGGCTGVRVRSDGWEFLPAPPAFAESGVTAYAATSAAPDLLFATDGHLVARSRTGGCSWEQVLDRETLVRDTPEHIDIDRVVDIDLAGGSSGVDVVYVLVELDVAGVLRTDVLASQDAGRTWQAGGLGLPALGGPASLVTSPTSPQQAYVVVNAAPVSGLPVIPPVTGVGVYATEDGGRTWARRTGVQRSAALESVEVDPAVAGRLLGRGPDGVGVSADGGATFTSLRPITGGVSALATSASRSGTRVLAADAQAAVLHRSSDGGKSWQLVRLPAPAHSVALVDRPDLAAAAIDGAVVLLVGRELLDVTPRGGPAGDLALVTTAAGPSLLARAEGGILRRPFAARGPAATAKLPRVDLHAAPASRPASARLAPVSTDLALPVGGSREVAYTLDVPAQPTRLDVFFLVDTTASMQPAIAGLRDGLAQIVNDLAAAGISAQFGVGEFKDYPIAPWGGTGDVPYRLLRPIGPVDRELERAIESLTASGGGDGPESALPALYQAATGAGQAGPGTFITAGQGAGFRPGSLRVVVNVTDVPFHRESTYPGPSFAATVAALRGRDVRQIGLAVDGGGREDLEEMATATRAFAPPTGLDCDGDGRIDLAPGAPLVCTVGDEGLLGVVNSAVELVRPRITIAPAVIGLLRSVRDEATVELQALRPDLARVIGEPRIERVDARTVQRLRFTVRYTCPADGRTNNALAPLRAIRRDAVLAEASAFLRCIPAPPTAPAELLQPALPALAALVLVPPPPPPPAPVSQSQPNTNTNPNPNPQAQSQPQGQAGIVAVPEAERELVLAGDRDRAAEEPTELAMSRRSRTGDADAAAGLAWASVVVCGCAAVAVARSRAGAPVRVH